MTDPSHLGDRPLLLWSLAIGMLAVAFAISAAGLGSNDDLATAFFRLPFIVGFLVATFVMGFIRPELRLSWTIGMGGLPGVIILGLAQVRILFSATHTAGGVWPVAFVLALVLGFSLAYAGSSLGARAALRMRFD